MKKILTICSILLFASVLITTTSCTEIKKDTITPEFKKLETEFNEKLKTIKSRADYIKFQNEVKTKYEKLYEKLDKTFNDEKYAHLKGKVLMKLNKFDEALKKFETALKNSPESIEIKFSKVKALLGKRKVKDALAIFSKIEDKLEKTSEYIQSLVYFAYSSDKKEEYAQKLLKVCGDKPALEGNKTLAYQILAEVEKKKGDTAKAAEILDKAMKDLKNPNNKKRIEGELKQLKLINASAPEISAEKWFNSKSLDMKKLKGKAVVLDFFAPWCSPCRQVIPSLVKSYSELKDKGLVVIGYTRLYGKYSDDKISKGKVEPEEELKLIEEFCKRYKIEYPVAVASKSDVFDSYGVSGIPTLIMITKDGKIKEIEVGSGDPAVLAKKLEELCK